MGHNTAILEEAARYSREILETKLPADITYHTVNHTVGVVDAALEIGKASGLSKDELEIVELACWFHDVGYSQHAEDHEFIGADVAFKFLIERKFPEARAEQVRNCILATKMPQRPRNKLEEVVCDADLLHLAKDGFMHKTKLLQQELEVTFGHKIPTDQWLKRTCMFMENHHYFTEYARKNYDDAKQKNLEMIEQIQKKMKSENGGDHGHMKEDKQKKKDKKDKSKKKDKGLERGIETMFRLTSRNHIDLSSMADNKANIMISINAIILSVVVSVLIRRLEEFPYLVMPTIILTFVCLTTIVLSILVTRPQVALGKFSRSDIEKRKVNLLFFGNFHRMNLNDYEWAVKEMMKDGDYLYSNLIHDIYYLGVVLGKKYRLLRVSYTFFMFGFVISIVSFLVAEMFFRSAYPY